MSRIIAVLLLLSLPLAAWTQSESNSCFDYFSFSLPLSDESLLISDYVDRPSPPNILRYATADSHTFWYRLAFEKDMEVRFVVTGLQENDIYDPLLFEIDDERVCTRIVKGTATPHPLSGERVSINSGSGDEGMRRFSFSGRAGATYYLSVIEVFGQSCGHRLMIGDDESFASFMAENRGCIMERGVLPDTELAFSSALDPESASLQPSVNEQTRPRLPSIVLVRPPSSLTYRSSETGTSIAADHRHIPELLAEAADMQTPPIVLAAKDSAYLAASVPNVMPPLPSRALDTETKEQSLQVEDRSILPWQESTSRVRDQVDRADFPLIALDDVDVQHIKEVIETDVMLNVRIEEKAPEPMTEKTVESIEFRDWKTGEVIAPEEIEVGRKIVLNKIYFYNNTYAFKYPAQYELEKLAEFLNDYPSVQLEIQGHSAGNTKKIKPDPRYAARGAAWMFKGNSQELSKARAEAVKELLVNSGIAPERLTTKGLGDSQKLIEAPTNVSEIKKNMRVEIVFTDR